MPLGLPPTAIVSTIRPDTGSMRDTVPSPEFTTQSDPAPVAPPSGPNPTGPADTAAFLPARMRPTVLLPTSAIDSPSRVVAMPFDRNFCSGILATTLFVRGLIRVIGDSASGPATQTDPWPNAIPPRDSPVATPRIRATI